MPKVFLWVVWLSLCFAHIVRLVMSYSKRLPLSRGYLIVRGRRCFQESFFWPIKVAGKSGIRCRNLFLSAKVIIEYFLLCSLHHHHFFVSKVFKYSGQMLRISGWKWPGAAILTRFKIPGQRAWEQSFTYRVSEALDVRLWADFTAF